MASLPVCTLDLGTMKAAVGGLGDAGRLAVTGGPPTTISADWR